MKKFFSAALIFSVATSASAVAMKLEGSCAGKLADQSPIVFQYYSNFDGCQESARAAISYQSGEEGVVTGRRTFTEETDTYRFGKTRLVFPNSTGNTQGEYWYTLPSGDTKAVKLDCDVRDYEYAECP